MNLFESTFFDIIDSDTQFTDSELSMEWSNDGGDGSGTDEPVFPFPDSEFQFEEVEFLPEWSDEGGEGSGTDEPVFPFPDSELQFEEGEFPPEWSDEGGEGSGTDEPVFFSPDSELQFEEVEFPPQWSNEGGDGSDTENMPCFTKLSDVRFAGDTLQGLQFSNQFGTRIITAMSGIQTLTTTAATDGPFDLTFSDIPNGSVVVVTAYQSNNVNCSDIVQYTVNKITEKAPVINFGLLGSLLNFLLTLPSDFQSQSSDKNVIFSDICAFAGSQSDGRIRATFEILDHSDIFASDDAIILNGQHNVFVNCSGQCLNIAEQSDLFLFQICSFTSDPVIKYSDVNPANTISDHSVTIASAVSETSDIVTVALTEIAALPGASSIRTGSSTVETLFKALLILLFFFLFGMIFAPVW